jgi:hypothetical protein
VLAAPRLIGLPDEIRSVSLADHFRDAQGAPGLLGARRNVDEGPAPAIDPKEEIVAIWLAQHSGFPKLSLSGEPSSIS